MKLNWRHHPVQKYKYNMAGYNHLFFLNSEMRDHTMHHYG